MKVEHGIRFLSFTVAYATSYEFSEDVRRWLEKGYTFSSAFGSTRPLKPSDEIRVMYQRDDAVMPSTEGEIP